MSAEEKLSLMKEVHAELQQLSREVEERVILPLLRAKIAGDITPTYARTERLVSMAGELRTLSVSLLMEIETLSLPPPTVEKARCEHGIAGGCSECLASADLVSSASPVMP
jgi:hypothetical protein